MDCPCRSNDAICGMTTNTLIFKNPLTILPTNNGRDENDPVNYRRTFLDRRRCLRPGDPEPSTFLLMATASIGFILAPPAVSGEVTDV
jgi:hypothetical protein